MLTRSSGSGRNMTKKIKIGSGGNKNRRGIFFFFFFSLDDIPKKNHLFTFFSGKVYTNLGEAVAYQTKKQIKQKFFKNKLILIFILPVTPLPYHPVRNYTKT